MPQEGSSPKMDSRTRQGQFWFEISRFTTTFLIPFWVGFDASRVAMAAFPGRIYLVALGLGPNKWRSGQESEEKEKIHRLAASFYSKKSA
jgi:hypothetical protein